MEIRNRQGNVIYKDGKSTMRETVEAAVKSGANMSGADLRNADLRYADLRGAKSSV